MPTRRDFALTLGAATLGACVGTPAVPPAPVQPAPTATPSNAEPDAHAAAADAMTQLVRQRYGAHLSDEQIARVREDIVGGLRASDRLRAILLPNATEPDLVFAVHRGGDL
jgi:3-oxoacyl-ACP reductase-like protein